MAKPVPERIRQLVLAGRLSFSAKAIDQLFCGLFDYEDLIHSILFGQVIKKERDESGIARYKYTIIGPSRSGEPVYSCGKVRKREGREYFIITFHSAD
jgi:hypothetical protein